MSTQTALDAEISAMRETVGAASDAQLAEILGLTRGAVTQWRKRGSIPDKAKSRVESFRLLGRDRVAAQDRAKALGSQLMFEGRCLALFLAPSRDAIATRRIAPAHYEAQWREYADLFERICLACAEEIAERQKVMEGTPADALADLTKDDPADLLERIMDRARTPMSHYAHFL